MKQIIFLFIAAALFFSGILHAYDIPGMTYPMSQRILLLPKDMNKEVKFSFVKFDANGRPGPDVLAWQLRSPSGAVVCGGTFPDDGDSTVSWKRGPDQVAEFKFMPKEKGIYTVGFLMDCDARIRLSETKAENVYWGLEHGRFRTDSYNATKMHTWFYLPAEKLGESSKVTITSNYMHYSKTKNMTIRTDKRTFYQNHDAPEAPDKRHIYVHQYEIDRENPNDLYELTADKFYVITFLPRGLKPLIFFFDRESALAFKPYLPKIDLSRGTVSIPSGKAGEKIALSPGDFYRVTFVPDGKDSVYRFEAEICGKKYAFSEKAASSVITVPADNGFVAIRKQSGEIPAGKFLFARMLKGRTEIRMPLKGQVLAPAKSLNISAVPALDAKNYDFELVHETGRKLIRKSGVHGIAVKPGELEPGVWQVRVSCDRGKKWSPWSFFAVAKKENTSPVYAWRFRPVMDCSVESVDRISLTTLVPASALDLKRTAFVVNGKRLAPQIIGKNEIGVSVSGLPKGQVNVSADLYDKSGNRSIYDWGFMLGMPMRKTISFDKNGYMVFNGRKILPLIIYPPGKNPPENQGFNATLPQILIPMKTLDFLLRKNMKTLDSGCVYRGYYTPKGSDPFLDVERYMNSPAKSHPARLGMWMDEPDAYLPDETISKHLEGYRKHSLNSGIAGVCCTSKPRYSDMAKLGDYLMIDIYPRENVLAVDQLFPKAKKDAGGKPVWQLNQGFDYDGSVTDPAKFVPGLPSLRYAHWAAFRYGIQGVGFYQCGTAKASKFPGIFAAAVEFYRQAAALTFVLTQDDISGYLDLPAPLKSRVIRRDGRVYAIVQNASYYPCKAKIGVNGKCAEKIRVLYENRVLRQKNGVFHDVFRPLDSRIYEFTEGK